MKLTIMFIMAGIIQVVAINSYSQTTRLTFELKAVSVADVLKEIENQSEFYFAFNKDAINLDRKVDLTVKSLLIEEIMDQLFRETNVKYKIKDRHIILSTLELVEPQKSVSGKVTDSSGATLPGVSVVVKGTTIGVITDTNGKYILPNVPSNAVLQFTFVGMKAQEIPIENRTQIDVSMQDESVDIEEVVAIGYGTVKKSDLTGAVAKVNNTKIVNMPVASVGMALQGKAAGLQVSSMTGAPGGGNSIRIRGGNSISGSNEPLYVIDGFISGGDFNNINLGDIESVEVLKDASATSIYGSRGSNGVILVTTKRGTVGQEKVNVNFYQGYQQLPKKLPLLNGYDRATFANDYASFTGQAKPFPNMSVVTDTDWQGEIIQTAPVTNVEASLSGGNNAFRHFISGNFFNQEGIFKSTGSTRGQLRINLDKKITNWLNVGVSTNTSYIHNDNPKLSYYTGIRIALTCIPVYNADGSYNFTDPINGEKFQNPVALNNLLKDDTYSLRSIGNFYAELKPIKDLVIKSTFGVDIYSDKNKYYEPSTSPMRQDQSLGGFAKLAYANGLNLLNENTINYIWNLDKSALSVLGGFTLQKYTYESSYTSISGFSNDALQYNKLSAGVASTASYDSGYNGYQLMSFLARVNYSYQKKYLLTVTTRYDGSSRFAEGNKWAVFPSAALAWKMSDEEFIKRLNIFNSLKLRISYGSVGNQAIASYATLASLNIVNPTLGGIKSVGYVLGSMPNPKLKWETTSQFDAGFEASFLKDRLTVDIDYYRKDTKDLLMNKEIPWTSGYNTQLQNVGEIGNNGVELMVSGRLIEKNDFSWAINLNLSANRNKVIDLGANTAVDFMGRKYIDVQEGVRLYEGYPAGTFVGAVYDGPWKQSDLDANPKFMPTAKEGTAKFKDINGNGTYDGRMDYDLLGSAQPKFFGGFGTDLRYKSWTLNLFLTGSYGNKILNRGAGNFYFFGDFASNSFEIQNDRWVKGVNETAWIPRAGSAAYNIDVNNMTYSPSVQDGSYLRLQTLKLNYSLTCKKIKGMNAFNIYLMGSNLFTLTNYTWAYNPDVSSNDPVARGVDTWTYPASRIIQLGFNFEF